MANILRIEIDLDALQEGSPFSAAMNVDGVLSRYARGLEAFGGIPDQPVSVFCASGDEVPVARAWVESVNIRFV